MTHVSNKNILKLLIVEISRSRLHVCPKQFLYRLKVVLYYKDYLYIYAMYVFSLQQVVGGTAFSIIWLCPFLCLGTSTAEISTKCGIFKNVIDES